ncbi:hypothetical protein VSX61_22165 [Brenneria populi subsp. brevivirga]|uniref:hypothetical protein n=1 Tax=Brenneria populi TaxID=1505588 RepID=UPI002E17367C|nr:hypothetical protein [Brenneria populi subsp. brevivirga]
MQEKNIIKTGVLHVDNFVIGDAVIHAHEPRETKEQRRIAALEEQGSAFECSLIGMQTTIQGMVYIEKISGDLIKIPI